MRVMRLTLVFVSETAQGEAEELVARCWMVKGALSTVRENVTNCLGWQRVHKVEGGNMEAERI